MARLLFHKGHINMIIPIITNGTTQPFQTMVTIGYQFGVFINGNAGAWNGAEIAIQITPNNISQPITIATLTSSNPFINQLIIAQGLFLQFTITGATAGTSLNLFYSPLGVYSN